MSSKEETNPPMSSKEETNPPGGKSKRKFGGYHPKKVMSRDELVAVIKSKHGELRQAAADLTALAQSIGNTADFNFTALERAKKALVSIGETKAALDEIVMSLALRGKTKIAEECKL